MLQVGTKSCQTTAAARNATMCAECMLLLTVWLERDAGLNQVFNPSFSAPNCSAHDFAARQTRLRDGHTHVHLLTYLNCWPEATTGLTSRTRAELAGWRFGSCKAPGARCAGRSTSGVTGGWTTLLRHGACIQAGGFATTRAACACARHVPCLMACGCIIVRNQPCAINQSSALTLRLGACCSIFVLTSGLPDSLSAPTHLASAEEYIPCLACGQPQPAAASQ